jgi:hypothetical protein
VTENRPVRKMWPRAVLMVRLVAAGLPDWRGGRGM